MEIEADRELFSELGVVTAVGEFATPLAGQPKLQRKVLAHNKLARETSDQVPTPGPPNMAV